MGLKLNGYTLEEVEATMEELAAKPETGMLRWKSRVKWDAHFGLDVRTNAIEQLGKPMPRHFTMRMDHPPEFLGENTGPTSVEALLASLGSCMCATFAAQATARGVAIKSLTIDVESTLDIRGFFGLADVRSGLLGVKLTYNIDADAPKEALDEILEATRKHSVVYDSLTRPVAIEAVIRTAP